MPIDIQQLKVRWNKLFITDDSTVVSELYSDLLQKYNQAHRHYHGIEHIQDCLEKFDVIKEKLSDAKDIELAIWFHDVIYTPQNNDNEYQSALYARQCLEKLNYDSPSVLKIERLIFLTKHPSFPITSDDKYLLDIDLSILGSEPDQYDQYSTAIRKEYQHVPLGLYRETRKKILNSIIERKTIFETEYFKSHFQSQAIENVNREIISLEN